MSQLFCRIDSPLEIRSPLLQFEEIFKIWKKYCWIQSNLTNEEELRSFNFLKLKYRSGNQIIQRFNRVGSLQEIRSLLLNFKKFWKYDKSSADSCRIQSNLMNDEEFRSFNFLKLKYKKGDEIIQPFCRVGFS